MRGHQTLDGKGVEREEVLARLQSGDARQLPGAGARVALKVIASIAKRRRVLGPLDQAPGAEDDRGGCQRLRPIPGSRIRISTDATACLSAVCLPASARLRLIFARNVIFFWPSSLRAAAQAHGSEVASGQSSSRPGEPAISV